MKKKIFAVIAALLLFCIPLTACGENYFADPIEGKQDTSYVVVSNGGNAVQYGNYVYHINGYRGYDSEDATENYWGKVVKGALYRSELRSGKDAEFYYKTSYGVEVEGLKTFKSDFDPQSKSDFVTEEEEVKVYKKDDDGNIMYDDDQKPIEDLPDIVYNTKSYPVATKTIGTSGYLKGGIFIYGDYVYYASPSNSQDRSGKFEIGKTMFYRTKLDGTGTKRLYTSKNDTSSSEYAFYHQNGKTYLTVHDGSSIISVTVNDKGVESVKEIASDVTGVLFPVKDIYYDGIDTNGVEDFIYYTREVTDEDVNVQDGNITVAMRPDGSESIEIFAYGDTITLKGTDNGFLFYQDASNGGDVIMYTNLHKQFMGEDDVISSDPVDTDKEIPYSPTYREAYAAKREEIKKQYGSNANAALALIEHQSGTALDIESISDYTETICLRPDVMSNQVYVLCVASDGLYMYDGLGMRTVYSGTVGKVYSVEGNNAFFGDGSGKFFYINIFDENAEVQTIAENMNTTATFGLDVMGDFAVMFGEVDDYASDYTVFVNLERIDDGAQFVGKRLSEDRYDPDDELNQANDEE